MSEGKRELIGIMNRLEALERDNRRLKGLSGMLLVGVAAFTFMGQTRPVHPRVSGDAKTVEADRFIVRDEAGRVRVSIGINDYGAPGIVFFGPNKVSLGVSAEGRAALVFSDAAGKPREVLDLGADGHAGLELHGVDGKVRATLNVGTDGAPSLRLSDKEGRERVGIAALAGDSAGLILTDPVGKVRGALASVADGSASLDFMDPSDHPRLSVGTRADGSPRVEFSGEDGKVTLRLPDRSTSH